MSASKCRDALVSAFMAGDQFFAQENVSFENVAFTPRPAQPWAALFFVPSQPIVATLGAGGTNRLDGFFQVDLNFPLNTGTKQISDKATAIENTFTAGARFVNSSQVVIIASCGRSQGREVNGFFKVSVTAYFYAHIPRN